MSRHFVGSALLTVAVLLLAYAALDDITTDNARAFPLEYSFLAACGGWLVVRTFRRLRARL